VTKYPLAWPTGWKRTPAHQRTRAKFSKGERQYSSQPGGSSWVRHTELSIADGTQRVLGELQRFGVRDGDAIISTNLQLRLDGLPRSDQRAPTDPGVAVYWQRRNDKTTKCMATDRYDRVADNLAAIAATLEAMRAIERHGGAQILDRAFMGFEALPAPGQTTARGWREVFGFGPVETVTSIRLEGAYRTARSDTHPDKGGSTDAFNEVQRAYDQARQELGA
jgi:hypothetical protein